MAREQTYFFDTYAIIEILNGNQKYLPYVEKNSVLTKLNISELFYTILKDWGEEKAQEIINKYYDSVIDYGKSIIEEAAKFRLEHKKRDISMTTCIGYIISKNMGVRFLTGDKEFENMSNVEFVK